MMSAVYYVLKDKSPVKPWSFKERNELILSPRSRRNLSPVGNLTCGAGYEKIPVGVCFGRGWLRPNIISHKGQLTPVVYVAGVENSWGLGGRKNVGELGSIGDFLPLSLFLS